MRYYISTVVEDGSTFEQVIDRTLEALKGEGFGALTDIDVRATMKKKLNAELYNYRILGACNPTYAYQAILAEDKIGTMLPCNIIVQERKPGIIEVSAVDPLESMKAIENPDLGHIAKEVREKLSHVIDSI